MQNKLLTKELVTRHSQYSFFKHIGLLPNPDKILNIGGRNYDTLRDLKNDPHVWSCLQSRKSGVLSMNWSVEGNQSEFVSKLLSSLDIYKLLSDILEAPFFGFVPIEIIWNYSNDKLFRLIPISLTPKPQEWFFFDNIGNLLVRQSETGKPTQLPPEKILTVFHDSSYQNPYGTALLSKCYWSCTFKNGGLRFWVNFMERFGMPVVLGQYNRGATEDEINKLAEVLGNMTENSVIVAPADINVKLEESARSSSVELYYELIKLCNAEISKALLSQTLTTELDSGSYAASQTHFSIRREVIRADVNIAERAINHLIELIFKLNNIGETPIFKLIDSQDNPK